MFPLPLKYSKGVGFSARGMKLLICFPLPTSPPFLPVLTSHPSLPTFIKYFHSPLIAALAYLRNAIYFSVHVCDG